MTADRSSAAPAAPAGAGQLETTARDVAFCEAMLPQVSRTFFLSIEAPSPPLRDAVRVA